MARYINLDKLLNGLEDELKDKNPEDIAYLVFKLFIGRLSKEPTADVVPKSEVEKIFEEIGKILYKYDKLAERDKSEYGELIVGDIGFAIAELKKKYVIEVPIVRDLAEEAVDKDIQSYKENK